MDIKDLKVEKIALLLLSLFIMIIFIDYSFNITDLIKQKYKVDIHDMCKMRFLVLISIVPILCFISKTEWDDKPNILSNSILPFLTFMLGFYLYKIEYFQDTIGIFLLFGIQLISSLTYLVTVALIISKIISLFNKLNKWFSDIKI